MSHELYTIGHSNCPLERFVELLSRHLVTVVCDVRSRPYSQYNPQFNREPLQKALEANGIEYVFMGWELGALSDDPDCCVDGKVQFDRLANTTLFQEGLKRLRKGICSHRVSLMCAEKDPVSCHRMILVCRNMRSDDLKIRHILEDGAIEDNSDSEKRLMRLLKIPGDDLFCSPDELLEKAYDMQGEKIAHVEKNDNSDPKKWSDIEQ